MIDDTNFPGVAASKPISFRLRRGAARGGRLLTLLVLSIGPCGMTGSAPAQPGVAAPAGRTHDFARWEKAIAEFERQDAAAPPAKGAVLFVGSSTIVRWKTLARDFAGTTVVNRGFGGNQIVDSTHFADRMIFPYAPRAIFLRAGGNDINSGKTAEEVFQDFKDFVAKVRSKLPQAEIVFIGLSPTIKRWEQVAEGNRLNDYIASFCGQQPHLRYIDCKSMTLDAEGKPRQDLFVEDKLHLSPEGYKLLADKVRPFVPKEKSVDRSPTDS